MVTFDCLAQRNLGWAVVPGIILNKEEDMTRTHWILAIFAVGVLMMNTCSCDFLNPTSPSGVPVQSDNLDPVIIEMWAIAQSRLTEELSDINGDPYSVRPEQFRWELMDGMFKCNSGPLTAGCFQYKTRKINVWLERVGAVIHESKHAILFELKDTRWNCYEHPDEQPCT